MIINDLAVVDESYNFDLVTATTSLYFVGIIRQWIQLVALASKGVRNFENIIFLKVKGWVQNSSGLES